MFNVQVFLKVLEVHCKTFNLSTGLVWQLAENVFAAMTREIGGDIGKWTVIYYFDDQEVKMRDEQSHKQRMAREIQLLMADGFTTGVVSQDPKEHVNIAYFNDDPTGCNPENVINYATQLFAKVDNDEIGWLDSARDIPFSTIGR